MKIEEIKTMLQKLGHRGNEPVRPELADEIKASIPSGMAHHRKGLDTINIVIDLRISKLAAAAIIIATMILFAGFMSRRTSSSDGLYKDGKMLVRYILGGEDAGKEEISAGMAQIYDDLTKQGVEVEYYGYTKHAGNENAVLMQWKMDDGRYKVIMGDLQTKTVSSNELIELLGNMLQKSNK